MMIEAKYPRVCRRNNPGRWDGWADEDFGAYKVVPVDALVIEHITPGWELCPAGHPMPVESPSLCIGCDGSGWRRSHAYKVEGTCE